MESEIKKIKIKELPQTTSINNDDIFVESDTLETYKVTADDIAKYIAENEALTNKYVINDLIGSANGVAPLNEDIKIDGSFITYGTTANTAYEGSDGKILEQNLENHLLDENAHGYNTKIQEETERAKETENAISSALAAEVTRATAAENSISAALADEVTRATSAEDMISASLSDEVTRATSKENSIASDLADEISRALTAESLISDNLSAEITRTTAAESSISAALADEVTRATSKENEIASGLANEITRASNAETIISDNLTAEVTRATTKEDELTSSLSDEITRATAKENSIASDLADEISRALDVETLISDNLSAEITRSTASENSISAALADEVSRATIKEDELTSSLSDEITRAIAKENEIASGLADEVTRASNAETIISDNLSAEITRATTAESSISAALTDEVTRATTKEDELTSSLSDEVTRATSKENAITSALADEVIRASATEDEISSNLADEITRATSAENIISASLTDEVTRATSKENEISSALSGETARAAAAEADLSGQLNLHILDTSNPHAVTAGQLGLGNVDNTSDMDKPISTAQQSALNLKANIASPMLTGTPKAPTASAGTNTTQIATTAFVQNAVNSGLAASDAMIIKGTIGATGTVSELPVTYKTGWTYRVVSEGTYAGEVCEIGDLIIALVNRDGSENSDSDWCVAQTNINGAITGIKSGDAYITISQSGSVVTISHKDVANTTTASAVSPSHGGTFTAVKSITSDSKGHVTAVDTETVTIPGTAATTTSAGLESAADKTKLDSIAANAEVNQNAFSNVTVGTTTIAADSKTATLTLAAGDNVTLTPDAANDKITIAATDTRYTHPSYPAKSSGLYKVTVDETGHVSAASAVTKSDITSLGIPASDTNTHYTSKNVVGSSAAISNTTTALANGNVYLNSVENGAVTSSHKISGSGATTVTTDATGNIVISSTDTNTNTNTTYSLSKSGSTITLTGSDGSATSVTDSNTTYTSLKNPCAIDINGNAYDGSAAMDIDLLPFIEGTQTSSTGSWKGNAPTISSLFDGLSIRYWLPYAGSGNASLNLTLADGTTTGAVKCYYSGTSRLTTQYAAGNVITLTYRSGVSVAGSSATYTGWWADACYNTDTYNRLQCSGAVKCGTTAITAGNIIVGTAEAYHHLNSGTEFDITYPILYAVSSIAASGTGINNYLSYNITITTTQSITLTAYKPIYIKGSLSGTTFTPVSTTPLTQTVPTSADGYAYILLGIATSTTTCYLMPEHPVYSHTGETFSRIGGKEITGLSVSGQTVTYTRADGTTGTVTTQDTNTDTKVTQTLTSASTNYPVLLAPSGQTDTSTTSSYFGTGLTFNPGTKTLTAATFSGALDGNAATATKAETAATAESAAVAETAVTAESAAVAETAVTAESAAIAETAVTAETAAALSTSAGSATQPVYFSDGKPVSCTCSLGTSVPSGAVFTDTKVTQGVSTTASYRPLLLGYQNSTTEGFIPASVTNSTYTAANIYAQPSTGTISATAFKGDLDGNASTSSKWATAQTLTAAGDLTGSCSIDGSSNVTMNLYPYYCQGTVENKNNYPYHRIAKLDVVTGSYVDKTMIFLITQDYNGGYYGIARVSLRTNTGTTASSVEVQWLIRKGFALDALQAGIYNVFGETYCDLFYKSNGAYSSVVVRNLGSGSRGNVRRTWTLINSAEANNTTTDDALTSTECYVSIEDAGTALHSQAYSKTVSGSDAGTVNAANSAAKLTTARTINGTAFNGTANITTSAWGTARNISISDSAGTNTGTAVSVNGSANVTLKLPATIVADLDGNATTATSAVTAKTAVTAERATSAYTAAAATTATSAEKLGTVNVGDSTTPIYLSAGTATPCTHSLGRSVPASAPFELNSNEEPDSQSIGDYWLLDY